MDIKTITENLNELNNRIDEEARLGEFAKHEIIKNLDECAMSITSAMDSLRKAVVAQFNGRSEALGVIVKPKETTLNEIVPLP